MVTTQYFLADPGGLRASAAVMLSIGPRPSRAHEDPCAARQQRWPAGIGSEDQQ
jgi:hypothetical protein